VLDTPIQFRIVSAVLDHLAGVSDGGSIPGKKHAHFRHTQAAYHMGQIHGDLARESGSRRSARRCAKIFGIHFENQCHGGIDQLAEPLAAAMLKFQLALDVLSPFAPKHTHRPTLLSHSK